MAAEVYLVAVHESVEQLWCSACQLPSGLRIPLQALTLGADGVDVVDAGEARACERCGAEL